MAIIPMFVPVSAAFADDPLLRLQGFGREAGPVPTTVDCGPALSNVGPRTGGSLYQVARESACQKVARRQVAVAFAGGLFVFMLGAAGVVAAQRRRDSLSPAPVPRASRDLPAVGGQIIQSSPGDSAKADSAKADSAKADSDSGDDQGRRRRRLRRRSGEALAAARPLPGDSGSGEGGGVEEGGDPPAPQE